MSEVKSVLALTTKIVSAYIVNNPIASAAIPTLIKSVHNQLVLLASAEEDGEREAVQARPEPAVPIRQSLTPTHLICLEDGRRLVSMKRHLRAAYGMSPDEYRERWGLPADYPMVAPAYALRRSKLAKESGLGLGGNPRHQRR